MKLVDVENWNRKEHYEFFSSFTNPQLNIVAEVDCTKAYQEAKLKKHSFFASYLHKSMMAINSIKEFRYRIVDEKVYEFDIIHAGSTFARDDGTFAFGYVPYSPDFEVFVESIKKEISLVKNSTGLRLGVEEGMHDLIRHTTLPWIHFTGIMHPSKYDKRDSVPKIAFGKIVEKENKFYLPVSIEAHHGLIDGYHVSLYFDKFQRLLNS
ncbi:MAG TPA: chloramphenicol acetyltransferase [Bacteriovoracaceae bacterium]|nr:chloramphenicol acetyltransferase [Bacteriovoracaceae bacterium]